MILKDLLLVINTTSIDDFLLNGEPIYFNDLYKNYQDVEVINLEFKAELVNMTTDYVQQIVPDLLPTNFGQLETVIPKSSMFIKTSLDIKTKTGEYTQ